MKKSKQENEIAENMKHFMNAWLKISKEKAKKLGKPSNAQKKKIEKLVTKYKKESRFSNFAVVNGEDQVYYNLAKIAIMTPPEPARRIKHKGHWYVLESSVRRSSGNASQHQSERGYFPTAEENQRFSDQQRAYQGAGPGGMT